MRTTAVTIALGARPWIRRLRLLAAIGIVWAALHFLIGPLLLPTGLSRPVTLATSSAPALAAIALAFVLCAGAYLGTLIAGPAYRQQGLIVVSVGLAAWALEGGTMTDWLLLSSTHGAVGPPSSSAYWPLLLEYVYFLAVMAAVALLGRLALPGPPGAQPTSAGSRLKGTFDAAADPKQRAAGFLALVSTTLIIGLLMLILTGPSTADTLRGQVYFAVAVSCALAVFLTKRLLPVRHPIWYWPAPLLAGLLGVLVAALDPDLALPSPYNQLNSIPAWGLARPLPAEMVGVGVTVTLWTLRAAKVASPPEAA